MIYIGLNPASGSLNAEKAKGGKQPTAVGAAGASSADADADLEARLDALRRQ